VFKRFAKQQVMVPEPPRLMPPLHQRAGELGPQVYAEHLVVWTSIQQMMQAGEVMYGWFDVALHDGENARFAQARMFYTDQAIILELQFIKPRKRDTMTRVDFERVEWFGKTPDGDFGFAFRHSSGDTMTARVEFLNQIDGSLFNHVRTLTGFLKQANPDGPRGRDQVVETPNDRDG
jgi:hypothetical protein